MNKKASNKKISAKIKAVFDRVFWWHVAGMALVLLVFYIGVKMWLGNYTRHGEEIVVPNMVNMNYDNAKELADMDGLQIVVNDTGYNRSLPANCILAQDPVADSKVKKGRKVYVIVNSDSSPTLVIPDIVNNCSLREAESRLMALGFKLLSPKRVRGERDWVVGLEARGRMLKTGDRVSVEMPLRIHVGYGVAEAEVEIEDEFSEVEETNDVILVE